MRCAICKKEGDEVELFEGVLDAEMIMVCAGCSEKEGVPLIRRPTQEQIAKSHKSYSVRERMERMSGTHKATPISEDQSIIQGNLARLKVPEEKQTHPDILDNYYWQVNMGRRRKKITLSQMAQQTSIPEETLEDIEKGKIPKNHEEIFLKLEKFLGVKLLKVRPVKLTMTRTVDEEKEILKSVKRRMEGDSMDEEEADEEIREEKVERITHGKFDFSKRENLKDVTLSDMVEMKRRKEKKEKELREKSKKDSIVGDEIDLEIEEV